MRLINAVLRARERAVVRIHNKKGVPRTVHARELGSLDTINARAKEQTLRVGQMNNFSSRTKNARTRVDKKSATSGLSKLQKQILVLALENQNRRVEQWEILNRLYDFPLRNPGRKIRFSKQDVPHARYNSATVTACRAFHRIVKRGLAVRLIGGLQLTKLGEKVARGIRAGGKDDALLHDKKAVRAIGTEQD